MDYEDPEVRPLLHFLHQYVPDPITCEISRLAAQDEARHVAFGLSHLVEQAAEDDGPLDRLEDAIPQRHDVLAATAGLNEELASLHTRYFM